MRQQLLDLHEVQKIDVEIREIENQGASVSEKLAKLESSANVIRTEVKTLTEQRETTSREIKTLEGTVQAEAHKLRKWEARLNEIRNQREYLALSREVEGSKRANREAEEKILEFMAQRDQIEKKLDELQDKLAEEEVDCATERAGVERVVGENRERLAGMKKRREVLLPKIPRALLKKYDAIREKRLGVGLVTVVDGCCQGCNMKLPPQLYNILQRGDSIEQCPSCQRIIFWDHFLADQASGAKGQVGASP
ncbi:MAG: hypothetical protein HY903_16205 [Deltaproteobacteria bacterium]|nr:hypothetical protein [Deltaproteobacteria bacterium]